MRSLFCFDELFDHGILVFRALLEDPPNGSLFFWHHVRCYDVNQYVARSICLQERQISTETQVSAIHIVAA